MPATNNIKTAQHSVTNNWNNMIYKSHLSGSNNDQRDIETPLYFFKPFLYNKYHQTKERNNKMKTLKAFLELFGKMVLSLAIIISIAFAIIAIIGMLKLGSEYKNNTADNNQTNKITIEITNH